MFSYSFQLGFNGKGNLQTTLPGGIVSILLNMVIFAFFVLKLYNVVTYADNLIQSTLSQFELNDNHNFKN